MRKRSLACLRYFDGWTVAIPVALLWLLAWTAAPAQAPPVDEPTSASAAPAVADPIAPPPLATRIALPTTGTLRLLRTLETFHKDVKAVHATFDQQRLDEIFLESVDSTGELWFAKPDRFRCDYADPRPMTTLIVNEALYVYIPELKQVDYWAFESTAERDQQLHQLLIGFGFKTDDLVRRYDIHSSEDEPELKAELDKTAAQEQWGAESHALLAIRPRAADKESAPFVDMKLYVDKARMLPAMIWYRDHTDSQITMRMKKIERDATLEDKLFDDKTLFPAGTERINRRVQP
jgi:outer membrane lipoprotein-sorting protein